jgi:hypothetical protein
MKELGEPSMAERWVRRTEMSLRVYRGEWSEVAQQARILRAEARESSDYFSLVSATSSLAHVYLESQEFNGDLEIDEDDLEAMLGEAAALVGRAVNVRGIAPYSHLVRLRIRNGHLGDARRILSEAEEKAGLLHVFEKQDEWELLRLRARLARAEGRWTETLVTFEEAAGYYVRYGLRPAWARTLLDWAAAHAARADEGDDERARVLLQDAHAAYTEMGAPGYAHVARDSLAGLDPGP